MPKLRTRSGTVGVKGYCLTFHLHQAQSSFHLPLLKELVILTTINICKEEKLRKALFFS